MSTNEYYIHQSKARGIYSETDIEALVADLAPVYSRVLRDWLPADRKAYIYEAACGPGILIRWLKKQGYSNITATDRSAPEIALAQRTGLEVLTADSIEDLTKRAEASFDCVIAIDFIEHLPRDSMLDFLRSCHRVLKQDGSLILRAPNGDSPVVGRNLFNDITHVWAYTTIALRALAQIAGFGKIEFVDDTVASVRNPRWLKVPLMRVAQILFKLFFHLSTREKLECVGASYYVRLRK